MQDRMSCRPVPDMQRQLSRKKEAGDLKRISGLLCFMCFLSYNPITLFLCFM